MLERYPVCEASAALLVPCGEEGTCVWVADNEHDRDLFAYDVEKDGTLVPRVPWQISLGKARVDDIEALARDGDGVLAFGSHGRDSKCRLREERAGVARVRLRDLATELLTSGKHWRRRLEHCDGELIVHTTDPARRAQRSAVCDAIVAADRASEKVAGSEDECPGDAFNIEGAAAVPGENGTSRIWIGLRAPLVERRAVLLRLVPEIVRDGNIAFDAVATVDLGGRGIRELSYADGFVWGIAGSVEDSDRPSVLWRMPAALLRDGATILRVQTATETLPPTAEGLVIQPEARRAIVLADGDTDKKKKRCVVPARQLVVPLF
ncbi:MAG TPA: DUF3616 domain-containing protein [Candidatus Binatia bacterium]